MSTVFATLQLGSTGAAVRYLQEDLKTLKYYTGTVDGTFGAKTKDAVIKFQQQNPVAVDGIVGIETKVAILKAIWLLSQPVLKQGSTQQPAIRTLQKILQSAVDYGIGNYGITKIDGIFGANTKDAVIKFQKDKNIAADGVVGAATWKELSYITTYDMSPEQILLNNVFAPY